MINWPVFFGVAGANFGFIFLKAFQQLNVTKGHYWWVMPTSFMMAIGEVYVVFNVAQNGFTLSTILSCGLGGGLGAICSMFVHKKLVGVSKNGQPKKEVRGLKSSDALCPKYRTY